MHVLGAAAESHVELPPFVAVEGDRVIVGAEMRVEVLHAED